VIEISKKVKKPKVYQMINYTSPGGRGVKKETKTLWGGKGRGWFGGGNVSGRGERKSLNVSPREKVWFRNGATPVTSAVGWGGNTKQRQKHRTEEQIGYRNARSLWNSHNKQKGILVLVGKGEETLNSLGYGKKRTPGVKRI